MKTIETDYESPSAEVVEVYSEGVICVSGEISVGGYPDWPEVNI